MITYMTMRSLSSVRVHIGRRAVAHTSVYALTRPLRVRYIRYIRYIRYMPAMPTCVHIRYIPAMPTCVRYIRYTYVRYV